MQKFVTTNRKMKLKFLLSLSVIGICGANEVLVVSTTQKPSDCSKSTNNLPNLEENYEKLETLMLSKLEKFDHRIKVLEEHVSDLNTLVQNVTKEIHSSKFLKRDTFPENCLEVKEQGNTRTGTFLIKPKFASNPFLVVCDMTSMGGGWTIFLNRFDGSVDFYLNWQSYKHGFGNFDGEFWLGLEKLYQLSGFQVNELLVELVASNNTAYYAHYESFSVGSLEEGYYLKTLGGFSGTAQNALTYHAGSKFSTKDKDQDNVGTRNSAVTYKGAWWHLDGHNGQLTGLYKTNDIYQSARWGYLYKLKVARMLIRPKA